MPYCPICSVHYGDVASICPRHGVALVRTDPLLGQTVDGKYTIEERLGAGGMGVVYRATQIALRRTVALKIILSTSPGRVIAARRFEREALAVARLKHPNIVAVYDFGVAPDLGAYLVMEFLEGTSLRRELQLQGRVSASVAIEWARPICSAVHAAHTSGVIHRDLKPDNIFLEEMLDGRVVKVLDFGIAKMVEAQESDSTPLTGSGGVIGTPVYMSPEQCAGEPVGPASDIYSLGCVLYEMVTGQPPFIADSTPALLYKHAHVIPIAPRKLAPYLPAKLEVAILRTLAKRPEDRFASAADLRLALVGLGRDVETADVSGGDANLAANAVTAPVGSATLPPNNLQQPLTHFVGRDATVAEIRGYLGRTRLLTIAGPGGIGKTRIALRVASDSLTEFRDGVWVVELAAQTDGTLVLGATASALGIREDAARPLVDAVVGAIREKRMLVVLDNCEHLLDACSRLVETLLRRCPNLVVVATSREAIGVPGEVVFNTQPLELPASDPSLTPERALAHEAVELFVQRAKSAKPGFELTTKNQSLVVRLCRNLDGIPLAIELAAARVKAMSVGQILARLEGFEVLSGGGRTALPRHQTLRATIDWSYDLLTEPERSVFRRVSVFAGGWTLEAAECVCAIDGAVFDLLGHLVDKSLVMAEDRGDEVRYRMLETIRQYARVELAGAGEAEETSRSHRAWLLAFAEAAFEDFGGPDHETWHDRMGGEHENFLAALEWGHATIHEPEVNLRLCVALGAYWDMYGHWSLGRKWLDQCLAACPDADATLRSRALFRAGSLAVRQAAFAHARTLLEECLSLVRESGNRRMVAEVLSQLGFIANNLGDRVKAIALLDEALALHRSTGHAITTGSALHVLGSVMRDAGEYGRAHALLAEGLEVFESASFDQGVGITLCELGLVLLREGRVEDGLRYAERGLAVAEERGLGFVRAYAKVVLGQLALEAGDTDRALALCREALVESRDLGATEFVVLGLECVAQVYAVLDEPFRAVAVAMAAEAIRETTNDPAPPAVREAIERRIGPVRASLSSETEARAAAAASRMSLETAVAYALGGDDEGNMSGSAARAS